MLPFLVLLAAYFLGAIPFGYLLVKWRTGTDVRSSGSGNIGATNVLRTTGRAAGVATLLLDMAKGYFAVWLAGSVMAGHAYSIFLRFRGGKAVASFVGAFFCLTPLPLVATLVIFVAVVAWTRFISMGSIVGAAVFPMAVWLILQPVWPVWTAALIAGLFIIYKHKSNLERLHAGTEHRFRFGSPK